MVLRDWTIEFHDTPTEVFNELKNFGEYSKINDIELVKFKRPKVGKPNVEITFFKEAEIWKKARLARAREEFAEKL